MVRDPSRDELKPRQLVDGEKKKSKRKEMER